MARNNPKRSTEDSKSKHSNNVDLAEISKLLEKFIKGSKNKEVSFSVEELRGLLGISTMCCRKYVKIGLEHGILKRVNCPMVNISGREVTVIKFAKA